MSEFDIKFIIGVYFGLLLVMIFGGGNKKQPRREPEPPPKPLPTGMSKSEFDATLGIHENSRNASRTLNL